MFPKNKINSFYRLLCLLSFIIVILMVKSITTLIVLFFIFILLALAEINFRNIELFVISLLVLLFCYWLGNYIIFKIIMIIDYMFYFLDTSYYIDEKDDIKLSQKEYVRFAKQKKKKKGTNNISAIFVTVHLVLLVIAIMVG